MLFKEHHIQMIRSGSKTATRREWERRQAVPGNVHIAATEMFTSHEAADCYIRVTDVYEQALGEMSGADAQSEGDYDDLDEFGNGYERVYGEGAWDPDKVVYVVEFEYVGRERPDQQEKPR